MKIEILQNIIDILRNKIYHLSTIAEKFEGLNEQEKIETLIIGSSHLEQGFKALKDKQEYNLATTSQDLYYTYNLYKYCNSLKPKIKNIVISFSIFTPGHSLIRTSSSNVCILLKTIFGIDYQYPDVANKKKFFILEPIYKYKINSYFKHKRTDLETKEQSETQSNFDIAAISKRAIKHYKNHQRPISQLPYLTKILEDTQIKRQNVIIVIPPATSYYKQAIPSEENLFTCLYENTKPFNNVKILNYYDSNEFDDSDFFDGDHLNSKGAEKLTAFIREILYT